MLSRARIETETPNVIDAGEDAPCRPSRQFRGCNSNSDQQYPPYYDDASMDSTSLASSSLPEDKQRQQQQQQQLYTSSNKGHISKGIRINYTLESDEEPDSSPGFFDDDDDVEDHEDDEEKDIQSASKPYGYPRRARRGFDGDDDLQLRGKTQAPLFPQQQQQQPKRSTSNNPHDRERSIREARLFAAAMLNESERRINLHNEENLSLRQESTSSLRQMMTKAASFGGGGSRRFYDEISLEEEPIHRRSAYDSKRHYLSWCRLVVAVIVILAVVLFGVFATDAMKSRTQDTTSLVVANPDRVDTTITFLYENEISTARNLYDESTPQYQAARWIATEDPEELPVPPHGNHTTAATTTGLRSTNTTTNNNDADYSRFVQRYVMAVLFYALKGEQWHSRHQFVTGAHECSWFETTVDHNGDTYAMGVTCNSNMQVRDLLLPSNNLVGVLPPEIRHLSHLTFLNLHNNTLTGSLPTELQALTLLNYLNLNVNQITGTIPQWLGDSLKSLQALGFSDNLLQGSIPGSLGNGLKPYLKSLSLDGNMLTGDIAPLQRLRYLKYLYLNDNDFVGRLDRGVLADMNFLEEVDLSGNRISGTLPTYLFTLNALKILDLSNNNLTGSIPTTDMDNSNRISPLEFVSFRNNSLSGSIPEELIPDLSKLNHLDLSFNQLTGDCPDVIGDELTSLNYFFIGDNPLTITGGTIPEHLQSLTWLRELSLRNLNLRGPIPTWIENFLHLRLLDLSENQLTGSIDHVDFSKLKHLRYLILHDNQLTGPIPSSMGTLQNLLVLSLYLNDVTDETTTAASICSNSTRLEFMALDCEEIVCPCCDQCCDKDDDVCFEGVLWETLEHFDGQWEERFVRSDYSFNPHVTLTGVMFEGELGCGDHCG